MKKLFITLFVLLTFVSVATAKVVANTSLKFDNNTYNLTNILEKSFGYINDYTTGRNGKNIQVIYYTDDIFQVNPFTDNYKEQVETHTNCKLLKYDGINHIVAYVSLESAPTRVVYHIVKFKSHPKVGVYGAAYTEEVEYGGDLVTRNKIVSDYKNIYNRQYYAEMLNFKIPDIVMPKN